MSKLVIKASEIANLTDARYFSARDVEWLGFSLDSNSDNFLSLREAVAIKEWISGPGIVAEMGTNSNPDDLVQAIQYLKPDAVQIGPFFPIDALPELDTVILIRELIPDSLDQLDDYLHDFREWKNAVHFFMLNLEKNAFSWQQLKKNKKKFDAIKELCSTYKIVLSLVFDLNEISEIISQLKPYGLSFKGGAEEKVGIKSFDELDEIFDLLDDLN